MSDDLAGRIDHRHADVAVTVKLLFGRPKLAHTGRAIYDLFAIDHGPARSALQIVFKVLRERSPRIVGQGARAYRRLTHAHGHRGFTRIRSTRRAGDHVPSDNLTR